ncbi:hypothetical protein [Motilibacter rhizosphaerae]|nr:hypothetical protein [Motilibacter rhizosphaerae]
MVSAAPSARADDGTLANLAHLDFLGADVTPPAQAGHTTWQLDQEPHVGVLWTYANRQDDGGYEKIGGGAYDAATDTYGQGAFNADDIARAAVAYLRYHQQHGDAHSLDRARELLRGLTYLQTTTGPHAGDVVLWMQPDGTLHPSATPADVPDPSDSGPSYWLARTVWALGEGYADLRTADPAFAGFLQQRLDLAVGALEREVLVHYGTYAVADGKRVPRWLVVDGSDASAEAVLGLSAYASSAPTGALRDRVVTATRELAEGIADLQGGGPRTWPYGAILPTTTSRSLWHAWSSQQAAALAAAARATGNRGLLRPALLDASEFTARLLVDDGPDNGWQPTPSDRTQIAYGVDSRLEDALALVDPSRSPGLRELAAVDAAWFFGANRAGQPMYDRSTGRGYDGLAPDGTINHGAGAESTIHAVLAMLALDAHPDVRAAALALRGIGTRDATQVVEGESGTLSRGASVTPVSTTWDGESLVSGTGVATLPPGSSGTWTIPGSGPRLLQAVLRLPERGTTSLLWRSTHQPGWTASRGVGAQGVTPAPGALLPGPVPLVTRSSTVTAVAGGRQSSVLDAILVTPVVSTVELTGTGHEVLEVNGDVLPHRVVGRGRDVRVFDRSGRAVRGLIPPGGYAVLR